jgi:reactive intermediate/imine deaminase
MRNRLLWVGLLALSLSAAEKKTVTPSGGPKPVGPYSPGILVGDYLYVSGQGAARADGSYPPSAEEQVQQCLDNVRSIVEAAGLTMEHIVYTQVYLQDLAAIDNVNHAWRKVFTRNPPARATLGVHRMPTDTPVEITVVAVRDLARKKVIQPSAFPIDPLRSPGILTGDRLYISDHAGRDGKTMATPEDPATQVRFALDDISEVLKAAGMDFRHVVFMNPYLTAKMPLDVMNRVYARQFEFGNTPARATIRVAGLPGGAAITFTGIAVRELSKRKAIRPRNMAPSETASPCVFADDTLYCSAKAGFIPGPNSGIYASTVETQVRQTMRNLLDGLEEAGLSLADVVATNVYLDDITEFSRMNRIYAEYFTGAPPTRTTVQQSPPVDRKPDARDRWPALEQISLIAVK